MPLSTAYDVALVDLDGVVYVGPDPVPGAPAALEAVRHRGMRLAFVTNNASRTPEVVAAHLVTLGVAATPAEVVTAAQAAARVLSERLPAGAAILVVGGAGLRQAVAEVGLREVPDADHRPEAVIQGYATDITYLQLAEAALALWQGVPWVASNLDKTLPSPRGLVPGNGALVAVLATATGRRPIAAGKPELPLHLEAVRRTSAQRPIVVGDRLDTDVAGAVRAGTDSLLVLTGVTRPRELLAAPPGQRPTYLAGDLSGLLRPHPTPSWAEGVASCGSWRAVPTPSGGWRLEPGMEEPSGEGSPDDGWNAFRALCTAVWSTGGRVSDVAGPGRLMAALGLA